MDLLSLRYALFVAAAVGLVFLAARSARLVRFRGLPSAATLALNLLFLAAIHPAAPAMFLGVSLAAWGIARLRLRGLGPATTAILLAPLASLLFLPKLGLFGGRAGSGASLLTGFGDLPLYFAGVSYFTLRAIHFVIDAGRERRLALGLLDFLAWNGFFPAIVAGPIERAEHFAETLSRLGRPRAEDLREGMKRIYTGLLKKVVLGSIFLAWSAPLLAWGKDGSEPLSAGRAWLSLYAFALYAYVDFAGYSDLAIGAGRLLGIRLAENFDNPYLRPSIAAFWQGWHISLSQWIRDYLFFPMCGRSASRLRPILAAVASFALCGLWHAPTLGWLLWGAAHGAALAVHQAWVTALRRRFELRRRLASSWAYRAAGILLTFHFVALTWTLVAFGGRGLGVTGGYLLALLGLAGG